MLLQIATKHILKSPLTQSIGVSSNILRAELLFNSWSFRVSGIALMSLISIREIVV